MRLADRIVDLLYCLQSEAGGLGITEIAGRTGFPKGTVHGLLKALAERSLVVQDPVTQRYGLGLGLLVMASSLLRERNLLLGLTQQHMERLRDTSGETVCLHVAYGLERACVGQVESFNDIRYTMEIGKPLPLYSGATGKLLLAHMPEQTVNQIIAVTGLEPLTTHTISDPDTLRRELAQIRITGYAVSFEERSPLVAALAAPIWDGSGKVIACLTIYGPRARLDDARVEELLPALLAASTDISRSLAAPPVGKTR